MFDVLLLVILLVGPAAWRRTVFQSITMMEVESNTVNPRA
jgi:hypothetical protein